MLNLLHKAYQELLFWKWDLEYQAAQKRMRGCTHTNTMLVDVGVTIEKCRNCWAILVPMFDGSEGMQWLVNCASPRRSRVVQENT